jgi:protein-tyrosine phosphatase
MRGFVDLHSHWIAGIDDGCRTPAEGIELLRKLHAAGFDVVAATPHMRPGMFENDRAALTSAYEAMTAHRDAALAGGVKLPEVHLGSEHFFDDVVFKRLVGGAALPFPGGRRTTLVELPPSAFPAALQARLFDLRRAGLTVLIAHPERYQPVWKDTSAVEPLLDAGAHLQLDVQSLVGKYGRMAQKTAEKLLEEDAYEVAASDAHKPSDVEDVVRSIGRLEELVGKDETRRLLADAPRALIQ